VEDNVERLQKSETRVSVHTSTSTDVKEFKVGKAGSGFVRVREFLSLVLSSPLHPFLPWYSVLARLLLLVLSFIHLRPEHPGVFKENLHIL
jgi:hypothetical protein